MSALKSLVFLVVSLFFTHAHAEDEMEANFYSSSQRMLNKKEPMHSLDPNESSHRYSTTESKTLRDIVADDPSLTNFNRSLTAADLSKVLNEEASLTVFAPNDEAFAKLSPNAFADLLKPENRDKLYEILAFHIVPGKLTVSEIQQGELKTLNGKPITVKGAQNSLSINSAKIVRGDIAGNNGVIHIIDTVIMPSPEE